MRRRLLIQIGLQKMAETNIVQKPIKFSSGARQEYNFQEAPSFTIDVSDSVALHANKIAEHEGKLSGLAATVGALQSYKGFLQAAILTVTGIMLAAIALVFNHQLNASSRIEKAIETTGSRISTVETKMSTVETKVDALPDRVSQSIREVSRDLVIISREPARQPVQSSTGANTPGTNTR